MKYALFAGSKYYPAGGWFDFQGLYVEQADAFTSAQERANTEGFDWYQIVDLETLTIASRGSLGWVLEQEQAK